MIHKLQCILELSTNFIINANMMESDLAFSSIVKLGYPWVYRHDRGIYQKYNKIDPLQLAKNCIISSSIGYLVGKVMKRREKLYSILFCFPIVVKYAWDQWTLKDSQKNYQSFKIQVSQQSRLRKQKKSGRNQQKKIINESRQFQTIRKMPSLQNKIYCASDYINQLKDSYFQ